MKAKRHSRILQLITEYAIDTQEELLKKLQNEGLYVTQATVSRDIKELRLIKIQEMDGSYKYATAGRESSKDMSFKFHAIFSEAVQEVNFANNIIVVKCYTGMANAACASLDAIEWSGVLGTIAGDDTIFILMKDNTSAADFSVQLKKMMRD